MSTGSEGKVGVGSVLLMDSEISSTTVGVKTVTTANSKPAGAGTLILDNVKFNGVQQSFANYVKLKVQLIFWQFIW